MHFRAAGPCLLSLLQGQIFSSFSVNPLPLFSGPSRRRDSLLSWKVEGGGWPSVPDTRLWGAGGEAGCIPRQPLAVEARQSAGFFRGDLDCFIVSVTGHSSELG